MFFCLWLGFNRIIYLYIFVEITKKQRKKKVKIKNFFSKSIRFLLFFVVILSHTRSRTNGRQWTTAVNRIKLLKSIMILIIVGFSSFLDHSFLIISVVSIFMMMSILMMIVAVALDVMRKNFHFFVIVHRIISIIFFYDFCCLLCEFIK